MANSDLAPVLKVGKILKAYGFGLQQMRGSHQVYSHPKTRNAWSSLCAARTFRVGERSKSCARLVSLWKN